MTDPSRYFDHAATTPMHPAARAAMLPYLADDCGNANSIHEWGRRAREAVEHARAEVAAAIGAEDPHQIVFTSGATESNNWVLRQCVDMMISPIEHSSLRVPARLWHRPELNILAWEVQVMEDCDVSVMAVNNETGGMPSLSAQPNRLHVDATQAIGKVPWNVGDAAWASLSGHKLGGPKGVGALYTRDGYLEPILVGGGQESGLRAGTLNVPGIVGFGVAAREAMAGLEAGQNRSTHMRSTILEGLSRLADWRTNDAPHQSPHILSLSFLGVLGETLVIELDRLGFAVSSGAACSSESEEESPVLRALGVPLEWNRGTIRVSFGPTNTEAASAALARALVEAVEKVRGLGRNP